MRYKLLGRTGLRVSELCLGAMIFGDQRGPWGATPEDARQIFTAYAEAGGNFVDTANTYSQGHRGPPAQGAATTGAARASGW